MNEINVHIKKGSEQVDHALRKGLGLMALRSGIIEYDCRKADCGICIVRVQEGADHLSPKTPAEADFLTAMRADPDERLACQCRVFGDVRLEVEEFSFD
jgi:ferredoxin